MSENVKLRPTFRAYNSSAKNGHGRRTQSQAGPHHQWGATHRGPDTGRAPPGRIPGYSPHGILMPGRPPPMEKATSRNHMQSGKPNTAPIAHQIAPPIIRRAFENKPHPLPHATLPDGDGRGGLHPRRQVQKNLAPPQHLPASGATCPARRDRTRYLHSLGGVLQICDQIMDTHS